MTLNVAGVIKDWILIALSAAIFMNPVTRLNLMGYSLAFMAVAYYNQVKIKQQLMKSQAAQQAQAAKEGDGQSNGKV